MIKSGNRSCMVLPRKVPRQISGMPFFVLYLVGQFHYYVLMQSNI